ncbi:SDR family oxidoreductase [Flavitalea sp. BT771]|uniref:SDR family oxidoreductase n=1 Tax=Flavitalea sp. BT771 TaxID=3063329 RepID=UPI0026E2EAF2|nr:SDR family oxidoreductase [Flavitalea sp. BT771]MDO6434318.1 SDR family oxidoreductase [Flavitalea sp. BT771]MDV6223218.1 SDR family oxidoreductase [Flavitalea sp. BT771]
MTQTKILITGATGSVGSELVKQLSAKHIPFRALVRTSDKTNAFPAEAEIIQGDLGDPESVRQALQGIEKAFLLTNSSEQAEQLQSSFVDIAATAGIQHIVKLSQLHARPDSPVRFLRYHAAVEQRIKDAGMAYTFLRPNLYMQGLLGFRGFIAQQGKFFAAAGNARISLVDIRDIAAMAAAALLDKGHEYKTYDITGPQALTHEELAAHLSAVLEKPVHYIDVTPEQMQQSLLSAGFPQWQAEGVIEDYAHYARGEAAAVSPSVEAVTAHPPRDFKSFARDYAPLFS